MGDVLPRLHSAGQLVANGSSLPRTIRALDPANPSQTVELTFEEADVLELLDGPAHHVWDLERLVPEVLRKGACVAVFAGLRRDGALAGGRAYCGKPSRAYRNTGEPIPPHEGMCFVVFVNDRGAIFDWDWMPAANALGLPVDWTHRFGEPLWLSLRDVERSEVVTDGETTLAFSCPDDYRRLLCSVLALEDADALGRYPSLVAQVQADWHRQGQNGCLFAKVLNSARPTYGWETAVMPPGTVEEVARWVEEHVRAGIDTDETRIVSLVFPWLTADVDLAALLRRLAGLPGWSVAPMDPGEDPVRLAARVALCDGEVDSWVLGFGPFAFLPRTRRAPFTEIVIPVKPKVPGQHRMDDDMRRSHLADVPVPALLDPKFEGLVASTGDHRRFVLGGAEDERAKAKVTYAIPSVAWEAART